jgi:hypothetical protein
MYIWTVVAVNNEMSVARTITVNMTMIQAQKRTQTREDPLKRINPRKEEDCKKLGSEADPE